MVNCYSYNNQNDDLWMLFDTHPDMIVNIDENGNILYSNTQYKNTFHDTNRFALFNCEGQNIDIAVEIHKLKEPPHKTTIEQRVMTSRGEVFIEWNNKAIMGKENKVFSILCIGRDITEKKGIEKELERLKERYQLSYKGANDALYDWDLITNEIYHSSRWSEMFEFSDDINIHHINDWKSRVHPEDLPRIQKIQTDYLTGKTSKYVAEYRIKTKSGGYKWIFSTGKAVWDDNGTPLRMAGSNTDITDSRKNEENIREISALFRAILDTIPDVIGIQDSEHNILEYNQAGYKFFDYSSNHISGHKCYKLLGHDMPSKRCVVEQALRTKEPVQKEQYNKESDKWYDVRAYPVIDSKKNVVRVVEHIRDITKQKHVEKKLQISNSILRAQQEAAIDGILVLDEKHNVIQYNKRFMEMFNFTKNTINARHEERINHIKNQVHNPAAFTDKMKYLEMNNQDISRDEVYLKNGMVLDRYSAPVISDEGVVYGRIWFFRDITHVKKNEMALQKSLQANKRLLDEIVEFDKLKTEFFSNISHELRTPINVIFSTIQLMELCIRKGEDIGNNSSSKHIRVMKQNCYRLLRLINNIIDITKMDAGYFNLYLGKHNIVGLIEDIIESVANYARNMGLEIVFDTNVEEKVILCDGEKIERIILNLLSNAIKYTKKGGTIWVNIYDSGPDISVSVKDTGIGIPKDKLDTIFDRFIQVDNMYVREKQGSGIGLSLVKNLVQMHEGEIKVKSVEGEGSEFIFILPVEPANKHRHENNYVDDRYDDSRGERINIELSEIYSME